MMNSFPDNIMFSPNVKNKGSNVIFDTCIRYDKDSFRTIGETLVDVFEFVEIGSYCFGIFTFDYIKGKTIRKSIY